MSLYSNPLDSKRQEKFNCQISRNIRVRLLVGEGIIIGLRVKVIVGVRLTVWYVNYKMNVVIYYYQMQPFSLFVTEQEFCEKNCNDLICRFCLLSCFLISLCLVNITKMSLLTNSWSMN